MRILSGYNSQTHFAMQNGTVKLENRLVASGKFKYKKFQVNIQFLNLSERKKLFTPIL